LYVVLLLLAIRPNIAHAAIVATYHFGPGWATFGLVVPRGVAPAGSGLQIGSLPTQTDLKTTWPDGSIRFAVLSARIQLSGFYPITTVPRSTAASFTPLWPLASVTFIIDGVSYVAALPPFTGVDSWLDQGALVREARVVVAPTSGVAPHPLLQVIFDVRSYADGGRRVDVTVQNVKDVTTGDKVSYAVAIAVNGREVFSRSGVVHYSLTRWRKIFLTDGLAEATVVPDLEPFFAAHTIPRFRSDISDASYAIAGAKFDILQFGDFQAYMPATGGRPEIGWFPDWIVRYLVFKKPDARAYMIRHSELSASWSGHITEPDGTSLITLSKYPDYWLDARADAGRPNGPSAPRANGEIRGTRAEWLENAHLPSVSFVPYLITGDRFHLDQQRLWAAFTLIKTWHGQVGVPGTTLDYTRKAGLLLENQTRGVAWSLRAIGDMLAYLPDASPDRAYFATTLQRNLDWLEIHGRTFDSGPLGTALWQNRFEVVNGVNHLLAATWQEAYVAYELHRLLEHGFAPGAALRDRFARFHLRMFSSEPDYPRTYAGPYFLLVGVQGPGSALRPFTTMREVFDATYKQRKESPTPFAGWYGPEERTMLLLARRIGLPGAEAALNWLDAQPDVLSDLKTRPRFAVDIAATPDSSALPVTNPERPLLEITSNVPGRTSINSARNSDLIDVAIAVVVALFGCWVWRAARRWFHTA
jgi:hypothetical protein